MYEIFQFSEDASLTIIMITTSTYSNENVAPEDIICGFDETQATGTLQQAQSYLSDEQNSEFVNAIKEIVAKLSVMAISGTAIKLPTQILQLFVLAVGVVAAVHLLAIFFDTLMNTRINAKRLLMQWVHSGLAVMMTSLTTSAGLLSFSSSEASLIADLGLFFAYDVLISLLYTLILLPSVIALLPLKQKADAGTQKRTVTMDNILNAVASIAIDHSRIIIIITAVIVIDFMMILMFGSVKLGLLSMIPNCCSS